MPKGSSDLGEFPDMGGPPSDLADNGDMISPTDGQAPFATPRNEVLSSTSNLNGVACMTATLCAAVGDNGIIYYSNDAGMTWTKTTSGVTGKLLAITASPTQFVAANGTGGVLTSTNGKDWTPVNGNFYDAIVYGNGAYVGIASNGIDSSTNGTTWTNRTINNSANFFGLTFTGSQFIAVGGGGGGGMTPVIETSPDGTTWTDRSTGVPGGVGLLSVAGNSSVSVASGGSATPVFLRSPDAITWSTVTQSAMHPAVALMWTGMHFFSVGFNGEMLTSTDGTTWVAQASGLTFNLFGETSNTTNLIFVGAHELIATAPHQ